MGNPTGAAFTTGPDSAYAGPLSLFPHDQSHHNPSPVIVTLTDSLFLPLTLTVYSNTAGIDFATWKPHPVTPLLRSLQ